MKTVIVLGATGMLGSMVYKYLAKNNQLKVIGTTRELKNKKLKYFDAEVFNENPKKFKFLLKADFVINTIGIIKPFTKTEKGIIQAISVNALFPHKLSEYLLKSNAKVFSIATDCVFSGKKGDYDELSSFSPLDTYDQTKHLGEVNSKNTLNIRCSIIGPQTNHHENLMQWFLDQKSGATLNGFSNHFWNGVTTLQFAQLLEILILKNLFNKLRKENHMIHLVPNDTVSKYELLKKMNIIFSKNLKINKTKSPSGKVDRSLKTIYPSLTETIGFSTIESELIKLREFIDKS